jgi:hypothetical protein
MIAIFTILVVIATLGVQTHVLGYLRGSGTLLALGFATIGARIAERHPRNAVGWLILVTGVAFAIIELAIEWVIASVAAPADVRLSDAAVRAVWVFDFVPGTTGSLFLLLFPDGRLASRRWLVLAALALACGGAGAAMAILLPLPPLGAFADPVSAAGEVFATNPISSSRRSSPASPRRSSGSHSACSSRSPGRARRARSS